MQVIKYKFADGTANETIVSEELYLIHLELVQKEKRNHWKETRRHISLNYLLENGIDFEDNTADTLAIVIQREKTERVRKAVSTLSDKQQDLIHKVYYKVNDNAGNSAGTGRFSFLNIPTNENNTKTPEKDIARLYLISPVKHKHYGQHTGGDSRPCARGGDSITSPPRNV